MNALSLAYVAVGGAFGSMCRYIIQTLFTRYVPMTFPFGTFIVNILGSFLLGVWIASIVYLLPGKSKDLHLLIAIGTLGGFTTFSTFALESFMLIERGLLVQTIVYIVGSVFLSILAILGGMALIKFTFG